MVCIHIRWESHHQEANKGVADRVKSVQERVRNLQEQAYAPGVMDAAAGPSAEMVSNSFTEDVSENHKALQQDTYCVNFA